MDNQKKDLINALIRKLNIQIHYLILKEIDNMGKLKDNVGIKIRTATKADLYRIAEMTRDLTLHMGTFEWSVENHLKHVKRRFSKPRYFHLVAVLDNKIIGFTGAELKSTRTAYMMKGFVEPAYRKRGLMRLMEGELIDILKKIGVNKIDLKVDTSNKEGRNTWIALGYKTIRETMRKEI
jgi:GNAT superfamily N-acetyltransferase